MRICIFYEWRREKLEIDALCLTSILGLCVGLSLLVLEVRRSIKYEHKLEMTVVPARESGKTGPVGSWNPIEHFSISFI